MGSYMFYAPELFKSSIYDSPDKQKPRKRGERTDIWGLGITMYYLLTGQYPFEDAKDPLHLRNLIINRDINFDLIKKEEPRKLLQSILEKDPEKRATLLDIVNSEWISLNGQNEINF